MKPTSRSLTLILGCALVAGPLAGSADTTFTVDNTAADSFLSGAAPTLNFGGAGTLAISPASAPNGAFNSILKFNLAGATSLFDSTYGAGHWQITGLTLRLASNFGTQGTVPSNGTLNPVNGGDFAITWLAGDDWVEGNGGGSGTANGAVSFSSLPSLFAAESDSLGTFTYTPPGKNIYASYTLPLNAGLVNDAASGGDVSLYFSAADDQVGYLFNSRSFASANPQFVVSVVPEPGALGLAGLALGGLLATRRWRRRK